ncbi:branched-chain amino acid ABC transporter permease [Salinisphaera sp. LB1]|uniref:branched-chain amino acid ABC transporter permease n=1 Tax=Salinisphaera sp. LB1 TaxID=2183911 RepID=UPI000D708012|nr:branched-chain amino acid ABC transporter permease [Salinisphaera sp. LB1]AWN15502.1 High-affinity branched-chain amino acid transport system permease protein LivH [Salinisphaera sp. LB1]
MDILQLTYNGIVLGSILALGAIGLTMIFGVLRFAHFAHGDLMTVGAYIAFTFVHWLGWPIWLAAIPAIILTSVIAVILDQLFYRRMRRVAPVILLISSFATALMLRALVQIIWGPDNQVYETGISIPYRVAGLVVTPDSLKVLVGAVVMVVVVHLFLAHTKMGKAMRAMSDNVDLARLSGVPVKRVIFWTWVFAGALTAVAGILLGMDTRLIPTMGWNTLLPIFAATILGGVGRPYGAILGGLVIGLAMNYSVLIMPSAYKLAVAFVIMIGVLILRPQGLLKGISL